MNIAKDIEDRLLAAVETSKDPDRLRRDLDRILPVCDISVSDRVETAQISERATGLRIEFGRAFLEQRLRDPQDLLFVFLHECFHHVLGHLARFRAVVRSDPVRELAANIAADILVNRAVCERFFPNGVGLLARLYDRGHPIETLLRPPEDPDRPGLEVRRALREAGFAPRVIRRIERIYTNGWGLDTPFPALVEQVHRLLPQIREHWRLLPIFLGNHSARGRAIEGLPWGAGESEQVEEDPVADPIEPAPCVPLALAVRRALCADPNHPRRYWAETAIPSPIFRPGRVDWPFLAMGLLPCLYHGARTDRDDSEMRAHVYVDVSISFDSVEAWVFGLILALADEVGPTVYEFSNVVREVAISDLATGRRITTGGTDFDCVIEHALSHRYRQIVVITDGIGDLKASNANAFQASGASLFLVLAETYGQVARDHCPLTRLAREVFTL